MKSVVKVLKSVEDYFYKICLIFSKGFFFYFTLLASLLHKIFPLSIFEKLKAFFKKKQEDSSAFLFLVFLFLFGVSAYVHFYVDNEEIHVVDETLAQPKVVELDKKELNLYRKYSKLNESSIDFKKLKKTNKDVVAWLIVDGTNINYPITQTADNKYYLSHDINKDVKMSGWTFMDYRNATDLSDDNTIFYGHNLMNKTAFGSLSVMLTGDWYSNSNHKVVVLTEEGKYVYEVFAVYTVAPEVFYLQNVFANKNDSVIFFNSLKSRSEFNFDIDFEKGDRIITLSTCSDDNKNRIVVHAKLIKE